MISTMHINEYIKKNRIPTKRFLAKILGITSSTLNNRIHEYGYDQVIEFDDKVVMVNSFNDKEIEHLISKKEIKDAVSRYWGDL